MQPTMPADIPDRDAVLRAVIELVADRDGRNPHDIRPEHKLGEDLRCDSLDMVEIAMAIEERFGVTMPDDLGDDMASIDQLADVVMHLLRRDDHA